MEEATVYDYIKVQFDAALPFVVYHKPNEAHINGIFLEDDAVQYTTNLTETGFVFAPFAKDGKTILFPTENLEQFCYEQAEDSEHTSLEITEQEDDRNAHIALVEKAIQEIKNKGMIKVVLSRKRTLNLSHLDVAQLFKTVALRYPNAMTYCWYHPKIGLWVGATPETLVLLKGSRFETMSLAGTQPYVDTEDVTWGDKEKEEQQLVTDTIAQNLKSKVAQITVGVQQTSRAGRLLHLKTKISGTIAANTSGLQQLITALHPTPAVCGLPRDTAADFIIANESYNRSFYTGYLGEINIPQTKYRSRHKRNVENLAYTAVRSASHLFVNLRCMQLEDDKAHLYVGGGITAASNPESEWEETHHKLSTMASVLSPFV